MFQEFPKWKYGENGESLIVEDAEAEAALGDGWHDTPLPPQEASQRASLIQLATEKGVKFDKRWSDARIRAAIEASLDGEAS